MAHADHVVIIGAGYAGLRVARELDAYCRVTLIDRRDLFFNCIGAVRAVVERGFEKTLWLNYKKVLTLGTVSDTHVFGV